MHDVAGGCGFDSECRLHKKLMELGQDADGGAG